YRQYEHIGPHNHLEIISVDGTDFLATYRAAGQAVTYLRERRGPVLFHARVTRPFSHSSADTQADYRAPADLAEEEPPGPLTGLKGKGGVFHVTRGLGAAFPQRVWNSPLAEATILGTAMGYSLGGFLPVVEVQFRDYIHPGWQQLVDEIATLRWRSNDTFACPMVIRVAYGDYLGGAGAIRHSEAGVGPIAHYPGLRVVVPSLGSDAVGLLREAVLSGDP